MTTITDRIYSEVNQLTTWKQYRDLLIAVLIDQGFTLVKNTILSEYDAFLHQNPKRLVTLIVRLTNPTNEAKNRLYSLADATDATTIDFYRQLLLLSAPTSWWETNALIDFDYSNGQYRFNNSLYPTETDANTAIGASKSGIQRTVGPYVFGSELCADGGFSSGVDGWTDAVGFEANGEPSNVSGVLRLTSTGVGTAYRAMKTITTVARRAYRYMIDFAARSASPIINSMSINGSANSGLGGSASVFSVGVTAPQTLQAVVSAQATTTYFGAVMSYTTSQTPTMDLDNMSVKECYPYNGYVPGTLAFKIKGITPAAASGNKVALQWGDDRETDRIRLVWDSSKNLRLIVTASNSEQANLNLGVVDVNTPFVVEGSVADNRVTLRLNGGDAIFDNSATFPGVGKLWVGRSFTGESWDGTIDRVTVWAQEKAPPTAILFNGDSYANSATSTGVLGGAVAAILTTRPVFSIGVGGTVNATQAAVLEALPGAADGVYVDWDGSIGTGAPSRESTQDSYARKVACCRSGKFIIIPPLARGNQNASDNAAAINALADIRAAYPNNYIDAQAILAARATSPGDDADVAAGVVPTSLLSGDATHLTTAAMGYVAQAVADFITTRGW